MKQKIKSSAILIALALGVAVSGLVVGISVAMSQFAKMSAQARDGKLAYRAAMSGIEDGLLRYRYAKANGEEEKLFPSTPFEEINLQERTNNATKMSYQIAFDTSAIVVGSGSEFTPASTYDWLNDSEHDNARRATLDNTIDINLKPVQGKIDRISVYFTAPYQGSMTMPLTNYFTALNVRVIDMNKTVEEQLVSEKTNLDTSQYVMQIDLSKCNLSDAACHLRIRPQLSYRTLLPNAINAHRVQGSGSTSDKKFIFYAISTDPAIEPAPIDQNPGTITLTSIGKAGQAQRRIQATIDASSGNYLGLFDYGIYCGKECSGL